MKFLDIFKLKILKLKIFNKFNYQHIMEICKDIDKSVNKLKSEIQEIKVKDDFIYFRITKYNDLLDVSDDIENKIFFKMIKNLNLNFIGFRYFCNNPRDEDFIEFTAIIDKIYKEDLKENKKYNYLLKI